MATRKEERERLREIRREAEKREAREQRRKLALGYAAAGILGAAVIAGIVVVIMSGGGGPSGEGHINAVTGNTNGVPPDDRTGTAPPPLKELNLKTAAKKAGCVLKLKPEGRGPQARHQRGQVRDQPADLRQPQPGPAGRRRLPRDTAG